MTLFSIIANLMHFGMVIVGLTMALPAKRPWRSDRRRPYGATTIADGDGSRQPSENELAGARYQGKRIAETAKKLSSLSPTRERESLVRAM